MKLLPLAALASAVFCSELRLQLRNINSDETSSLGVYQYDIASLNTSAVETPDEKIQQGVYCVDATFDEGSSSCFSFLDIDHSLHFNLLIDVHDHQVRKLSLVHNAEVDGIVPEIRNPVKGPEAPPIKLKKTTKTYQEKKAGKQVTTAQFSEDDNPDEKSWLQKNWKILAIGVVIYNVASVVGKREEIKKASEQTRKVLD